MPQNASLLPSSQPHASLEQPTGTCQAELQRRPLHRGPPPSKLSAAAASAQEAAQPPLLLLPPELIVHVLTRLGVPSLAACAQVSAAFLRGDSQKSGTAAAGLVEQALRLRAANAGREVPSTLPAGEESWLQHLLWRDFLALQTENPPTMAAGCCHTLLIDADRQLLSCGGGDTEVPWPVIGHGAHVEILERPTPIPSLQGVRITTVAASKCMSLAVTEAGQLFSWGTGYLGHGEASEDEAEVRYVPTLIAELSAVPVCRVAAGEDHVLAVTTTGALYSWGVGVGGRLGHGDEEEQLLPRKVETLQDRVCGVAAGCAHSLAVTSAGALHTWGSGSGGKLGHGDEEDQLLPKRVEALRKHALRDAAAGDDHSLALTNAGALYSWGSGDSGRLGHGDQTDSLLPKRVEALQHQSVCSVAAGEGHSFALTCSGTLYSWGEDGPGGHLGHGFLGSGDAGQRLLPTPVPGLPKRVCAVAAGPSHTIATTSGGRAWGWGFGEDASLGLQLVDHQHTPLEYPALRVAL